MTILKIYRLHRVRAYKLFSISVYIYNRYKKYRLYINWIIKVESRIDNHSSKLLLQARELRPYNILSGTHIKFFDDTIT